MKTRKTTRWIWALAAVFAFVAPGPSAQAHPHLWVTVKTDILYDADQRITGLRHRWTFDEFFSALAIQGLDENGDGILDRDELAPLAQENVESLKEYDYFTFAKANDQAMALSDPPKDYFLVYEDSRLTLHFTLPLAAPVDARKAALHYTVNDPTFFVDFSYPKRNPIRLAKNAPRGCRATLADPLSDTETQALSEAFFAALGPGSDFGRQFARDVVIGCDAR